MNWFQNHCVAFFVLLAACTLAPAQEQPATRPSSGRTVRLLTVGNSFSMNATRYVRELAAADGNELVFGGANVSGCSLQRHWRAAEAFERDPNDPAGKLYPVGPQKQPHSLREMLVKERWDFVTIQQASHFSDKPETYFPYAENLRDYIKQHAPQAEVLIHQTWAYRGDHPRFKDGASDPEQMHDAVRRTYRHVADKLDLRIIPVGDAFHAVTTHPEHRWTPDPTIDLATFVHPKTPVEKNTLHQGWYWKGNDPAEMRLIPDAIHANMRGRYLASCVIYEFLFGKSVVGNGFVPREMTADDARFLQTAAHETVRSATKQAATASE